MCKREKEKKRGEANQGKQNDTKTTWYYNNKIVDKRRKKPAKVNNTVSGVVSVIGEVVKDRNCEINRDSIWVGGDVCCTWWGSDRQRGQGRPAPAEGARNSRWGPPLGQQGRAPASPLNALPLCTNVLQCVLHRKSSSVLVIQPQVDGEVLHPWGQVLMFQMYVLILGFDEEKDTNLKTKYDVLLSRRLLVCQK